MKTISAIITLLLAPALALAAAGANEPSLLAASLKMVAALAVIIGLLLLIYHGSRKGFGVLPKPRDGAIKVLETRALGGKKFLCLVAVRGEELLLGMSNEGIQCLAKLPPRSDFSGELKAQLEDQP